MIDETGAFLTAALDSRVRLPRIPRRSVHHGGYGDLLKRPGARAAVNRWWALALEAVATVCDDA